MADQLERIAAVGGYLNAVANEGTPSLAQIYTAGRMIVGVFGETPIKGPYDDTGVTRRTPIVWRRSPNGNYRTGLGIGGEGADTFLSADIYNDESSHAPWSRGIWSAAYQIKAKGLEIRKPLLSDRPLVDGYKKNSKLYSIVAFNDRHELYDDGEHILGSVMFHFFANLGDVNTESMQRSITCWEDRWHRLGIPKTYSDFAIMTSVDDQRGQIKKRAATEVAAL